MVEWRMGGRGVLASRPGDASSDQGNQYRARLYPTVLARRRVVMRMDRKGNCYDSCAGRKFLQHVKE